MLGILLALLLLATGCEIRVVKSYPNCPEPLVEDLIISVASRTRTLDWTSTNTKLDPNCY